MPFSAAGLIYGAMLLALGGGVVLVLPKRPQLWQVLPRERLVGTGLAFVCLAWSAYLTYPLLEGWLEGFRNGLPPAVALLTVAGYFLVDYLFTRAMGGFLLLWSTLVLHEAFVAHAVGRPLLSLVCYAVGIIGMFLIATPWRLRDFLELAPQRQTLRYATAGALIAGGVISCLTTLLTLA